MRTLRTIADLRAALAPERRAGRAIALVPTMGAFHGGHLALMRRARAVADVVVVSLFVNPSQFAPGEDLARYPRDEPRDLALAAAEGVDLVLAPPVEEVYPAGFATQVRVAGLSETLEGAARGPEHFHAVATVVLKLLNMAQPDVAVFGQKDAQQVAVIRRMLADLDVPVRLELVPTVREPDGLAMSSRNAYLGPRDRARAVALARGLRAARRAVAAGEREPSALVASARAAMAEHEVEPEYLALVDPDTFAPLPALDGRGLLVVAARVGPARLIDNELLTADRPAMATR
jgi:pantoate--beta-alanine ligase